MTLNGTEENEKNVQLRDTVRPVCHMTRLYGTYYRELRRERFVVGADWGGRASR